MDSKVVLDCVVHMQDVVQRDEEICGLLLKITKQDAALKVLGLMPFVGALA
jgi:hypothetical protein